MQTHHIFKDQSQGFLGVDDVMEEHDVGVFQAFQERCCGDKTERRYEEGLLLSLPSLAASLECCTGPLRASYVQRLKNKIKTERESSVLEVLTLICQHVYDVTDVVEERSG